MISYRLSNGDDINKKEEIWVYFRYSALETLDPKQKDLSDIQIMTQIGSHIFRTWWDLVCTGTNWVLYDSWPCFLSSKVCGRFKKFPSPQILLKNSYNLSELRYILFQKFLLAQEVVQIS